MTVQDDIQGLTKEVFGDHRNYKTQITGNDFGYLVTTCEDKGNGQVGPMIIESALKDTEDGAWEDMKAQLEKKKKEEKA